MYGSETEGEQHMVQVCRWMSLSAVLLGLDALASVPAHAYFLQANAPGSQRLPGSDRGLRLFRHWSDYSRCSRVDPSHRDPGNQSGSVLSAWAWQRHSRPADGEDRVCGPVR